METDLDYVWVAQFKDGSVLRQFEDGKEVLFRKVLDRKDELDTFSLVSTKGGPSYQIHLQQNQRLIYVRRHIKTAVFFRSCPKCGTTWQFKFSKKVDKIEGKPLRIATTPFCPNCGYGKKSDELIERHGIPKAEMIFLLGWQSTVRGKNVKSILFILSNGDVHISDNMNWAKSKA